jgi:hypothetical protein
MRLLLARVVERNGSLAAWPGVVGIPAPTVALLRERLLTDGAS